MSSRKWLNYTEYHKKLLDRWGNWFQSIEHYKASNAFIFEIHCSSDDHGAFKTPFYVASVVEQYHFPILWTLSDYIFSRNQNPFKNYIYHKNISLHFKENTKSPAIAVIKSIIKYNKICATHPNYCIMYYTFYQINNKKYFRPEFYYFMKHTKMNESDISNKNMVQKQCISYQILTIGLIQIDTYKTKVQPKRVKNGKLNNNDEIKTFPFVKPYMVGKCNENEVFLANIEYKNDHYCSNGILNMQTGFVQHPFIHGSGDHLNGTLFHDIIYQFANLIVRNALNKHHQVDQFNNNILVTLIYCDVKLINYMELNMFVMILKDLKTVNQNDHRLLSLNFRPLFVLEMDVALSQFGTQCGLATIIVVPVYKTSNL